MRDLDPDLEDEFLKSALSPIFMVEGFFDGGTLRFWSGTGNLVWDSETFVGSGTLLSVSEVSETQNTEAQGVQFTLTGIPSSILAIALLEPYQGREIKLYIGALDDDFALVGEPYELFSGFMDVMEFQENGDSATITLSAEHHLIELKKVKVSRYTPEDQKRKYPGDKGLDFVPSLQDKEIIWGRKSPK